MTKLIEIVIKLKAEDVDMIIYPVTATGIRLAPVVNSKGSALDVDNYVAWDIALQADIVTALAVVDPTA